MSSTAAKVGKVDFKPGRKENSVKTKKQKHGKRVDPERLQKAIRERVENGKLPPIALVEIAKKFSTHPMTVRRHFKRMGEKAAPTPKPKKKHLIKTKMRNPVDFGASPFLRHLEKIVGKVATASKPRKHRIIGVEMRSPVDLTESPTLLDVVKATVTIHVNGASYDAGEFIGTDVRKLVEAIRGAVQRLGK